ncbi:MAG: hypothetical protein H6810_07735 [Phycisphaeraceae bacterium]|nr:MAG: hypothetical protein H6810_07735 [Phycisphaeraceae bacterium]
MSDGSLWTPILVPSRGSIGAFIEFWEALYRYPLESIYAENIGKSLTPERIDALYTWKNGGKIAAKKAASIRAYYHDAPGRLDAIGDSATVEALWQAIGGGGVVWGIFMLHIWRPARFPIFDQHVYRAMHAMKQTGYKELDSLRESAKIARYRDEYLPFWAELASEGDARAVDKALWAFGKAIKSPSGSDLNWSALITDSLTSAGCHAQPAGSCPDDRDV